MSDIELEPYRMPITRIIEENSLRDMTPADARAFELAIQRVKAPLFTTQPENKGQAHRRRIMRSAIDRSRKVTINRQKLIEKLKENRELHAKIHDEALQGYKKALLDYLNNVRMTVAATHDDVNATHHDDIKAPAISELFGNLPNFPRNSLEAYDEAIELFSWDESAAIELGVDEFRQYVLDKWDWQDQYLESTMGFSPTARAHAARLRSR